MEVGRKPWVDGDWRLESLVTMGAIGSQYLFAPIAVETLGPLNTSAYQVFGNLGRKISLSSGDGRKGAFLFQRVSVLVQRFNAVLLHDSLSLPTPDCMD